MGPLEQFVLDRRFEGQHRPNPLEGPVAASEQLKQDEKEHREPDEEFGKATDDAEEVAGKTPYARFDGAAERILEGREINPRSESRRGQLVELGDVSGLKVREESAGLVRRDDQDGHDRKDDHKESDEYRQAGGQLRSDPRPEPVVDWAESVREDHGDDDPDEKGQDDQDREHADEKADEEEKSVRTHRFFAHTVGNGSTSNVLMDGSRYR